MIDRRTVLKLSAGAAAALLARPLAAGGDPLPLLSRAIPSSGERLPLVGIGTARRFDVGKSDAEREPLRAVLRELPRLGGKLVDTAPSYGNAESVVGDLLSELGNRDEVFLATKVGAGGAGADAATAEFQQSLQRLRTDHVDLLQIHNLAGVDGTLPLLRAWKDKGTIRYTGVSTSSDQQYEALETLMRNEPLDFIQIDYAIDNRAADERILPLAADRNIAVLTNLPFGRGRVLNHFAETPIPDWLRELNIHSWAQFALKWVIGHPAVTSAIPGTAKLAHLQDNLGAARGPLPDETMRRKMVAFLESA